MPEFSQFLGGRRVIVQGYRTGEQPESLDHIIERVPQVQWIAVISLKDTHESDSEYCWMSATVENDLLKALVDARALAESYLLRNSSQLEGAQKVAARLWKPRITVVSRK